MLSSAALHCMGVPAQSCSIKQAIFTEDVQGHQIHCQVVHLGKQLYIWLGSPATASSSGLYAAVPVKHVRRVAWRSQCDKHIVHSPGVDASSDGLAAWAQR